VNATPIRTLATLAKGDSSSHARVTFERADGILMLTTTRDRMAIRYQLRDVGADFGPVTVRAEGLRGALCRAKDVTSVDPASSGGGIVVVTDRLYAKLPATTAYDAGAMAPGRESAAPVDFTREHVASLAWVARAMGDLSSRYGLHGVAVEEGGGRFAATDGNRLHAADTGLTGITLGPKRILPGELVMLAARLCKAGMGLAVDGANVYATGDGWTIRQRMTETDFLNYRAVVPTETKLTTRATVPAAEMREALRAVLGVAHYHAANMVKSKESADGYVVIRARHSETAATVSARVPIVLGDWPAVAFSAAYMLEALDGVTGDAVVSRAGAWDPIVVTGASGRFAVVMPIRSDS